VSEAPRPRGLLDRSFEIGVALKGLNGAVELVGGVVLLAVSPATINRVAVALTRQELSEDPHDFVATHVLHTAHGLHGSTLAFGAIYLLLHGLVKVVLVTALLLNKLWAYPWMIAFLVVFIGYQLYRIAVRTTAGLVGLTIFDAVVAWLTYREYRKQIAAGRGPPNLQNP
jgi:uncharacterized membrane protein